MDRLLLEVIGGRETPDAEVAKQIHAGMSTLEIDAICRQYCEEHHAIPACLDYEGFPMSVCTSINEVVCHGIPKEEDVLEEGDIVNVDFTTILDGYYADASRMFIIGKTTPEKEQLVRVAKECLEIASFWMDRMFTMSF